MATAFARLSALTDRGDARLVEIQAVPRSLSTALGRCLNEAGGTSVFINEPFNTPFVDVDIAARRVLQLVEPTLSTSSEPVTVITKNMARNLSPGVFSTWIEACSAVLWSVRDPWVQMSSLVTRTANDLLFGVGADQIEQDDLAQAHLAMVNGFLENGPESTDFLKTGWHAIGNRFAIYPADRPSFVADLARFSCCPDRLLRYLCHGLELKFDYQMVREWRRSFLNVNRAENPGLADGDDAWIKQAATSHGIRPTTRIPLDASILPNALRRHLATVALPTYAAFMEAFDADTANARFQLAHCDGCGEFTADEVS